jgi:hypothetical protein
MSAEAHLFEYNFVEEMQALEKACREQPSRPLNDLHASFKDVDDGLFAFLASGSFAGFDDVKAALPGWASDEVRQDSTGSFSFREHLLDASWFWRTVRDTFEEVSDRSIETATVADYGAGWGRISRFVNKDVPAEQFYALEPNPHFQDIYRECRLPGHLIETDWLSAQSTSVTGVDLIISYSILTHSSERLTANILERWREMTKPGSMVAFTMRPGFYLGERDGDMSVFSDAEHAGLRDRYDRGELIYKAYRGDTDWGVTIIPPAYLDKLFGNAFRLVKFTMQLQTSNQMIVFAQRI